MASARGKPKIKVFNVEFDFQTEEDELWSRLIEGLSRSSRWQFIIKIILILGGTLVSVIGSAMEGPLFPASAPPDSGIEVGLITTKGLMVILGASAAAIGGAILLFLDWDTPRLLDKAKSYMRQVRIYLDERDDLLGLDDKRRALLDMQTDIYEGCESMALETEIDKVVKTILKLASPTLDASIGFAPREEWAFSVFRGIGEGDDERMTRIAAHWMDREGEQHDAREWKKREGFTGWAWHDGQDVIVQDAGSAEHNGKYSAPADKFSARDPQRYVSAASIPIKIGPDDTIWGIVTATSSMAGRFKRNPHDIRSQNVETVRVLARLIATQVAMRQTHAS